MFNRFAIASWSVALLVLGLLGGSPVVFATIGFVQSKNNSPNNSSLSTLSATFASAQAAGDLNVVAIGWGSSTVGINSVTDSKGNTYTLAVGPTTMSGLTATTTIYYAKNIAAAAAGTNTVTVVFNSAVQFPDIRMAEYSGIDTVNPLDVTAAGSGTSTLSDSGSVTTTNANDLLIGSNWFVLGTTSAGTGYVQREISGWDGDILEDRIVTSAGSYSATAPITTSSQWLMQMAAFKAAGSGDTTAPTAPTGLTATAASPTQINLSWTASSDNVGVTGYWIDFCQGSGCSTLTRTAFSPGTSFSYASVAGTSYSFRVSATDAAGNVSGYSNTVSVSTPSGVSGLVGWWKFDEGNGTSTADSSGNSHSGTLLNSPTWTTGKIGPYALNFAGTGADVGSAGSGSLANLASSGFTVTAWIKPAGSGGGGGGRIVDKDNNDVGWFFSMSGTTQIKFTSDQDPSGTTSLTSNTSLASLSLNNWQHVSFTWDGYAGGTVHLYINGVQADGTYTAGSAGTPAAAEGDDSSTPLTIGGRQFDTARGFNGAIDDVRIYNRVLTATEIQALADSTAPTAPSGLTASATSSSQINLSWTPSTDNIGVTGYVVERCQGSGCSSFAPWGTTSSASFSDTGLAPPSFSFSYRVRATDAAGNLSGYSNVASATTTAGGGGDTTPPSAPTSLSATAISTSQINLSWTASTDNVGVTGYRVERCQGAGCTSFAQVGTPTGTSYSDSGLATATTYVYRIRATDAAGNLGGYSTSATAITGASSDTTPPSTPGGLRATNITASQVSLSWTASTDNVAVTGYFVERCQGDACQSFGQAGTPTGITYTDAGLTGNTAYSYRIRAGDAAGNRSPYSGIVSVVTQPSSGGTCHQ